jgi:large-conductance mechanosensitive channel
MAPIRRRLKKEVIDINREIRDRTAGYIVTALGLVAGLAWNNAIQGFIEYFFPANKSGSVWAKFIYAVILTLVVVFVSFYVVKLLRGKDIQEENQKKSDAKPKSGK